MTRGGNVLQLRPSAGRVPANDLDAEAAVLSAILIDQRTLDLVTETLRPEHFYSDANRTIYEAALELTAAGKPVDLVQVAGLLRSRDKLTSVGGPSYLAQISDATPAVANAAQHAQLIVDKARTRALGALGHVIAAESYGDVGSVSEWISGAEQRVYDLARVAMPRRSVQLGAVIPSVYTVIERAAERGDGVSGLSTGFEKFDAKTAGLHEGDLLVVAARPGMGKTAFVMNLAVNVASPREVGGRYEHGTGVVAFSLEMPQEQLVRRTICSEARVDVARVRSGYLQPDDWTRFTAAATSLATIPLWIDDTPAADLMRVRAVVRRHQAEYDRPATSSAPEQKVGLVIIDYLQLMGGSGRADNREQEIAQITRGLKQLAKELKVAVIVLSQLNRAVESRSTKDKRPQLADLRESGAIEQDADTVVFIYRDEYYNPETSNAKGIAELLIAKQRNGPCPAKVLVRFSASHTRFDNLAPGDYPEQTGDE